MLPEILSRETKMPVMQARDGTQVQPNRLYVIPPNTNMTIRDGVLHLLARERAPSPHMPIDYFLRSLAAYHGSRAIGVILSRNASDGDLGLKEIKADGSITFAQ